MRIGFGRLAQNFCPKHLQYRRHECTVTQCRHFGVIIRDRYRIGRHGRPSQALCHGFATSTTRLEEKESRLPEQDETIKTITQEQAEAVKRKEKRQRPSTKTRTNDKSSPAKLDPNTWIAKLDTLLPSHLRASEQPAHTRNTSSNLTDGNRSDPSLSRRITKIMYDANKPDTARVDLITYMGISQGRWKAVLWLAETLLQDVSSRKRDPHDIQTSSNIIWGSDDSSLSDLTKKPIFVDFSTSTVPRSIEDCTNFEPDLKYFNTASRLKNRNMAQIWYSLGSLIIEAAELPDEQSEIVMAVVYQVIAKVHALGLVPDNVYSYATSNHNSMIQRPPILHLLSSRVLTTLSDASWRSHQMEVIEQAVDLGTPLKSLVKDLPGGRFRLKVRPLGPEVWLEFVLWCCVEGGFRPSSSRIIRQLQQQTKNPWFALPWTSRDGKALSNSVDWDRVRSRHGGPVGLIEGYNRQPPFVEMPPRTISAEVVLSLVDTMIDSISQRQDLSNLINEIIPNLIEFLEPHNLPAEYFDYLAVRVLQADVFIAERDPRMLEQWVQKVSYLRSLESTSSLVPSTATFEVAVIVKQSELHAGMLHQAMEAHVDKYDVRSAVDVFNQIQELVDLSKVRSISAFLATTSEASGNPFNSQSFFSPHSSTNNMDFLHSHGQLPLHKLAAFLNLTTDSNLLRIGQWLLFADDVDEHIIPKRLYSRPALTAALVRFARASGDEELLRAIILARKKAPLKPSVSLLRSLIDAFIACYDFKEACKVLVKLSEAKGGGYGPANVANSAIAVLSLESRAQHPEDTTADAKLRQALELFARMMRGSFGNRGGDFRMDVLAAFQQQIAALLVVLSSVRGSRISSSARRWRGSFQLNNLTLLSTDIFNDVLASVVDTKGCSEGMRLWQLFCDGTMLDQHRAQESGFDEYPVEDHIVADDDDHSLSPRIGSETGPVLTSGEYVPFIDSDDHLPLDLDGPVDEGPLFAGNAMQADHAGFTNAFPVAHDQMNDVEDTDPMSLVKPDFRTLRIIVRGALAERLTRGEEGLDTSSQEDVLKWATYMFRLLGASTEVVEQEIQQAEEEHADIVFQQWLRDRNKKMRLIATRARKTRARQLYEPFRGSKSVTGLAMQSQEKKTKIMKVLA